MHFQRAWGFWLSLNVPSNMHPALSLPVFIQALKLLRSSPTQTEARIFRVLPLFCQTVRLVLVPTSSRLLSCTTTTPAWAPSPPTPILWCKPHHQGCCGKTAAQPWATMPTRGFRLSMMLQAAAPAPAPLQQLRSSSSSRGRRPRMTAPRPTTTWCAEAFFRQAERAGSDQTASGVSGTRSSEWTAVCLLWTNRIKACNCNKPRLGSVRIRASSPWELFGSPVAACAWIIHSFVTLAIYLLICVM